MVKSKKNYNSSKKNTHSRRYNKKGGGFFGGDDTLPVAMGNEPMPTTAAPVAPVAPVVPNQEIGENKDKECCPCNKGIGDMLNPTGALNKLEQNLVGAQEKAVNTVSQKVTDTKDQVKEKGKGFFSRLFGGPKSGEPISGGGRKSKRRTSRKGKGKRRTSRKGKGKRRTSRKGKGKGKGITRKRK